MSNSMDRKYARFGVPHYGRRRLMQMKKIEELQTKEKKQPKMIHIPKDTQKRKV